MTIKVKDCPHQEYCSCNVIRSFYCEKCHWYVMIDSGYGHCMALPIPAVVAWCKLNCSFYESRPQLSKDGK